MTLAGIETVQFVCIHDLHPAASCFSNQKIESVWPRPGLSDIFMTSKQTLGYQVNYSRPADQLRIRYQSKTTKFIQNYWFLDKGKKRWCLQSIRTVARENRSLIWVGNKVVDDGVESDRVDARKLKTD
jgi:hypothetical protein